METKPLPPVQGGGGGGHVLLLAVPEAQGHLNPMLQFGRRLAYHGLRPTLVTTRHLLATVPPPAAPFRVAAISDGFDAGGMAACPDFEEYTLRLAAAGSDTLEALFRSEAAAGRPVRALVYDPHLPWAGRVARAAGVPTAALFSQPCAVDVIYGEVYAGRVGLPVVDGSALRGLLSVDLGPEDVPSFVAAPDSYRMFLDAVVGQFDGLELADDVFVNSFLELEHKEADSAGCFLSRTSSSSSWRRRGAAAGSPCSRSVQPAASRSDRRGFACARRSSPQRCRSISAGLVRWVGARRRRLRQLVPPTRAQGGGLLGISMAFQDHRPDAAVVLPG